MKIKAVRKNHLYTTQNYLTVGSEYEVLREDGAAFVVLTDGGYHACVTLKGSSHGFDFEIVQEDTPKFKVGDRVICRKGVIINGSFVDKVGSVIHTLSEEAGEYRYEVCFGGCTQVCYEVLDDMVLADSNTEVCPDPMPVVEPENHFEQEADNVNNPSHYGTGSIECIDYIKDFLTNEEYVGYLRGNVAKYMHRFPYKNGIEDVRKAQWYLNRLEETLASSK